LVSRVLDASAFYAGIPFASQEKSYTTSVVFDEIKHIKKNHDVLKILVETKRLEILDPKQEYITKVLSSAKEIGDFQNLSKGDISVIALCLQLGGELVTDDFAISNTAKHLNLKVIPIMTKGINKVKDWVYFCSGCEKTFSKITQCPICGSKLSRKSDKRKSSSSPVSK
jgi:endoribonuclease Nob1